MGKRLFRRIGVGGKKKRIAGEKEKNSRPFLGRGKEKKEISSSLLLPDERGDRRRGGKGKGDVGAADREGRRGRKKRVITSIFTWKIPFFLAVRVGKGRLVMKARGPFAYGKREEKENSWRKGSPSPLPLMLERTGLCRNEK